MLYTIKPKPNANSIYSLTTILSVSPPYPLPMFHGFKTSALQLANANLSFFQRQFQNFKLGFLI